MKTISPEAIREARKQLAAAGYAALIKKYTKKQRRAWQLKGGRATKNKFKK